MLCQQECYSRIVDAIKAGARYLDIGPAVGQDMRNLILDGCPSSNMFALEIEKGYIDLAYKFWGDYETLKTQFIVADILDESNEEAKLLNDTVDIAHAGMVLHLFDLETQMRVYKRMVQFMKPVSGALMVGNSVGRQQAGYWRGPNGRPAYMHNQGSFEAMWKELSKQTDVNWNVRTWVHEMASLNGIVGHYEDPLATRLFWEIERP